MAHNMLIVCWNMRSARERLADKNEFFRLVGAALSPEMGESIMTLAKQFRDEGRDEGEPIFIMKIMGLSLSEIKHLQAEMTEVIA